MLPGNFRRVFRDKVAVTIASGTRISTRTAATGRWTAIRVGSGTLITAIRAAAAGWSSLSTFGSFPLTYGNRSLSANIELDLVVTGGLRIAWNARFRSTFLRLAGFIDTFVTDPVSGTVQSRFSIVLLHAASSTAATGRRGRSVVVLGSKDVFFQFGQFLSEQIFRKQLLQNGIVYHRLVSSAGSLFGYKDNVAVAVRF